MHYSLMGTMILPFINNYLYIRGFRQVDKMKSLGIMISYSLPDYYIFILLSTLSNNDKYFKGYNYVKVKVKSI